MIKIARQALQALLRLLNSGLFMDALTAAPLTAGCLLAIFAPTALDGGFFTCARLAALAVALALVMSRGWWASVSAAAALAVSAVIYRAAAGSFDRPLAFWRGFWGWLADGARYEPGVTDDAFLTVVSAVIAVAVAAVLFALVRRFFRFAVVALLQIGVVTLSYVLTRADVSAALCVSAAGLIMLLPRLYAAHLARLGTEGAIIPRARLQAVAIPAAALSALLAVAFVPQDTRAWRSHLLSTWIDDVGSLVNGPFRRQPTASSGFSLAKVGYQTETGRMGGPVALNDERYLTAQSDRPLLLKGKILTIYNGHNWREAASGGDLRLNSPLWGSIRKETFDLDKPVGGAEAKRLYEQLTVETAITVYGLNANFNTLFAPENMQSVTMMDKKLKNYDVYFNSRSELYLRARAQMEKYVVRARVWDTGRADFDALFTRLEGLAADAERYAKVAAAYTQLPEDLPETVRQTAAAITDGMASPYQKARALREWLAANAVYTLKPPAPPEDEDFTAHFLDTREGYCVYYATAMTVLARSIGLPARYVMGFALAETALGYYEATGQTAHAWSEVYFEGIGWLAMDPLSRVAQPVPDSETPAEREPENPRPSTPPVIPTPPPPPPNEDENQPSRRALLWIPPLTVLALFALYLWLLRAGPRRIAAKWSPEALRRRLPDASDRLNALYADTAALLALHGMAALPGETLVTYPRRVDERLPIDGAALRETADSMMRLHFRHEPPAERDVARACLYHARLEAATLTRLGKTRYFFRRVVAGAFRKNPRRRV